MNTCQLKDVTGGLYQKWKDPISLGEILFGDSSAFSLLGAVKVKKK
jgi:hypothetical protein